MIILIDTREQRELEFNHPYIDSIERVKLDFGDYAVRFKDGFIPPVYIERKSLGDLFGTMTSGYARFKKELQRAQEAKATLKLMIEANFSEVLFGYEHSRFEGISMIRKLMTLRVRHGIVFHCFNNRQEMTTYIIELFISLGKEHIRQKEKHG